VDERHLTASELAGYVDHALDDEARGAAEEHLEQCRECRDEAMAIANVAHSYAANAPAHDTRTRHTRPSTNHRAGWRRVAIGLGAVAAGLSIGIVARQSSSPNEPVAGVRAPSALSSESETAIAVAAPMDGATVPSHRAAFSWHRVAADTYRFTILTRSGELLWSRETPDTTVTLPATISLQPGLTYFWRVDAIADGIAATSGARQLLVRP
jgi:anti-sigma factor RsiW